MRSTVRAIFVPLAIAMFFGPSGCAVGESRQAQEKNATIRTQDINVTAQQLRLRMRSLVGPMCGQIEQTADSIIAGTTDVNLELAALKWKMQAVPAMREALFQPDPYTAALDTAILCYQLVGYFESGPGKQEFGPVSAQAAASCRQMADDYFQVIASATISQDVSRAREFVQKWATDHPIRHSISDRESALSRVYQQQFTASHSTGEYIADASASADDLTRKLDVYSNQLFRQTQWQIERLRLELVRDFHVDQTIPLAQRGVTAAEHAAVTVDHLQPALERTLSVAQNLPQLVTSEREAAIKAVHEELDQERVAALEQVDKERAVALAQMHDALVAHAQRMADDLDQMSTRKIDHVIQRVTWLVASVLAIVFLAATIGLFLMRRILVHTSISKGVAEGNFAAGGCVPVGVVPEETRTNRGRGGELPADAH
jgi:hypothetical protein